MKISGTALAENAQNVDPKVTSSIAREIAALNRLGVKVGWLPIRLPKEMF